MSKPTPQKKPARRGGLFPKRIDEVVKLATQPLMDERGKLYGALLRDWPSIVGAARATSMRPQKLHWPAREAHGATLHLEVAASLAPELAYETETLLEQCARYFGYRAIARIVLHPSHQLVVPTPKPKPVDAPPAAAPQKSSDAPRDMMEILHRMRQRIAEDDKR
ncbi:MAG: hypothetical protein DI582_02025 [Azospirillum brasilense]|nr:MAG: hypothetical protein DI582_02025 [Azospirillum brasilense]